MTADCVACSKDLLTKTGVFGLHLAELEEGGVGVVLRQYLQDLRCPDRVRTVVEAEEQHLFVACGSGCGRIRQRFSGATARVAGSVRRSRCRRRGRCLGRQRDRCDIGRRRRLRWPRMSKCHSDQRADDQNSGDAGCDDGSKLSGHDAPLQIRRMFPSRSTTGALTVRAALTAASQLLRRVSCSAGWHHCVAGRSQSPSESRPSRACHGDKAFPPRTSRSRPVRNSC